MRKVVFMAALIVIASLPLTAQQPKHNQRLDELKAKKNEFMRQKIKMTDEEEKAFWPVYNEFEQKKWEIGQQREALRRMKKNGDTDYAKLNDMLINSEMARAKLSRAYHERFKQILPPEKLFRYYMAEREFKENVLNDIKRRALNQRR